MPTFDYCIDLAQQSGKLSKQAATQLKAADAVGRVEQELDSMVLAMARQKRETAIAAVRLAKAWEMVNAHPRSKYDGLIAILTRDKRERAGNTNVEARQKYWQSQFDSQLADMLQRFRTRKFGFAQDEAGVKKLIHAIYGNKIDDPDIMKFAADWKAFSERAWTKFNEQGGSISKNDQWLLPQRHDAKTVKEKGLEQWKAYILPKLDRTKMTDDTGRVLTNQELDQALDYSFASITTHGLNKVKELSAPILGKKLSRKHSERRFLYFKDAQSWMDYQRDFGKGDIFTTLTDHVEMMSHDIALMEVLGPNPNNTFDALLNQVKKKQDINGFQATNVRNIFNNVSGKTNEGEMTGTADFMQTTRNLLTASTLGKAFLSSVTDVGFSTITGMRSGIPAFKPFIRQMELMTNEEAQVFAVKIGLLADAMTGRVHAANRFADSYGVGKSAKVAEGVMRASLLTPWTDAGRKGFGMEFSALLAENFGKQFDQLEDGLVRTMGIYGIKKDDWDVFRQSKTLNHKGAKFADMTQDGGDKFHQMIMGETDFAVPSPDANVKALTNWGLGRNTVEGQAWRSVWMLKSFTASVFMTHMYRMANYSTFGDRLTYAGALAATTTTLGLLALTMKDIAAGREPREVTVELFGEAFLQGGGIPILGDLIRSDVNRFGGGLTMSLIGPYGELIDTTAKLTIGNALELGQGKDTDFLGEATQAIDRYTPDVWYTYLFSNAMFDQLEMLVDEDAEKRFRKVMNKRRKEYEQDYWWKPGELTPEAMQ